jgi:hypothetical protein
MPDGSQLPIIPFIGTWLSDPNESTLSHAQRSPFAAQYMHLPTAIREDHNPVALLGLFGPLPLRPFLFLRWTSYTCPHCGHVFRRDFWPNKLKLGSGKRICRQCCKVFDDGTREWPELTLAKKFRFLFPPLLIGICGGLELANILTFFITPRDEHSLPLVVVMSLAIAFVILLVWFPVRLIWILRSNTRYKGELLVRSS